MGSAPRYIHGTVRTALYCTNPSRSSLRRARSRGAEGGRRGLHCTGCAAEGAEPGGRRGLHCTGYKRSLCCSLSSLEGDLDCSARASIDSQLLKMSFSQR